MNVHTPDPRIEQFRQMAAADPTNELGHLSLGRALLDAGEFDEAVASLDRALALNANLSKAYQLKGHALATLGRPDDAIAAYHAGIAVADARGEMLPRNDMAAALRELGVEPPAAASGSGVAVTVGQGEVLDRRTGRVGPRLPKPPIRGVLGRIIYENVSAESWREWIGMGTKVINELRLPLGDPHAQKVYDQHLVEFLNLREPLDAADPSQGKE